MSDLSARPDRWTDMLPASWQHGLNTSPVVNALSRMMNPKPRPSLDELAMQTYGTPEQQEKADIDWLIQQARGPGWLERQSPVVQDGANKLMMLANFVGPGGVKLPPPVPKPTGIRAYHGSPHDFDKFDISKIGTGEGAQAYGRGLYFSENPSVARSYEGMLTGNGYDPAVIARDVLEKAGRDPVKALSILTKETPPRIGVHELDMVVDSYSDAAEILKRHATGASMPLPTRGRMYEVNIKADPDQFLDWDKPLSQQPEGVRKAYTDALKAVGHPDPTQVERSAFGSSGQGMENLIGAWVKHDRAKASDVLRDAGIPGIKYLDQQSRAAGQGSRNYVVFDDKLIEILRKYGLLPPVAAGTAAALDQQEPPL